MAFLNSTTVLEFEDRMALINSIIALCAEKIDFDIRSHFLETHTRRETIRATSDFRLKSWSRFDLKKKEEENGQDDEKEKEKTLMIYPDDE